MKANRERRLQLIQERKDRLAALAKERADRQVQKDKESDGDDSVSFLLNNKRQDVKNLKGMYNAPSGSNSCILVCGGPSLDEMDLEPIYERGVLIAAMNNCAATHVRPHIWFSIDGIYKYHPSIYADPSIMKFVRWTRRNECANEWKDGKWVVTNKPIHTFPNVWYWKEEMDLRNAESRFLISNGVMAKIKGKFKLDPPVDTKFTCLSVMMPAVRILYYLGIRKIFLIGADFWVNPNGKHYAFEETIADVSIERNNQGFQAINQFFDRCKPHFRDKGLSIINCSLPVENSQLTAFPKMGLQEAVDLIKIVSPSTVKGMYHRRGGKRR